MTWFATSRVCCSWNCRRVGRGSKLVGSGSAVPRNVISNAELSKLVDTSDEWIAVRTGIRNRHVLAGKNPIIFVLTTLCYLSEKKVNEPCRIDPLVSCMTTLMVSLVA